MKTVTCKQCGASYRAQRATAKYCNASCRKAASRGGIPENRRTSPTKRRRENEFFELHMLLCKRYYGLPPKDRGAYLETLVDRAREGDNKIKHILTNVYLLRAKEGSRVYNFRGSRAYPTIAQEASRFTTAYWGVSIKDAVA